MGVRLLLIDDEESTRASLTKALRRSDGIDLLGAATGPDEASKLLERERPDIVLLNLHRRDNADDLEGCAEVCRLSKAPVVALASFMTPERWAAVEAAGVAGYLLKRVDTTELSREVAAFASRFADRERGCARS
jgi:DNA-binding NarL/FixJ family response regulator